MPCLCITLNYLPSFAVSLDIFLISMTEERGLVDEQKKANFPRKCCIQLLNQRLLMENDNGK